MTEAEKRERKRATNRAYEERHREKVNAKKRAAYAANPERQLARQRAKRAALPEVYRERIRQWKRKNRERHLEHSRNYYKKHKPKHRAYHQAKYKRERPKLLAQSRAYYYANKEKFRARYRKYMARKLGAAVGTDRKSIESFYKLVREAKSIRCYWCAKLAPKGKRHIDHIIPLIKGGADAIHNLCCSCESCNLSKGAKHPHEFSGQFEIPFAA